MHPATSGLLAESYAVGVSDKVEAGMDLELLSAGEPYEVINRLRESLAKLDVADPLLQSFTGLPAMTHAFFPGGNGLYEGVHAVRTPVGGTLVLGSNFGCYNGFIDKEGQLLVLDERNNPTWAPLLDNLRASGIKVEECFFTNAWPFLHYGDSNLGPISAWLRNPPLMEACVRFFEGTFTTLQPKLIVALGKGPAAFLSHVWPESLGPWKGYALSCLDDLPMATVRFQDHPAICVATTHPQCQIHGVGVLPINIVVVKFSFLPRHD